ncbi:MAG: hypothetical protein ACREUD_07680 [Gammaproteobacteria bacterium]
MTTNIQVVFDSMYGHTYRMAEAVVAGAREVAGTEVALYRQVAELVPERAARITASCTVTASRTLTGASSSLSDLARNFSWAWRSDRSGFQ